MVVRPTKSFSPLHPLGQQLADNDRNHRAEMADHGELALLRATAMDIAVAPAHRSLARTEISARDVEQRFAKSGASGLIANERREDVALSCRNNPQAALTAS